MVNTLSCGHHCLVSLVMQALTIIGLGTAYTNIQLMLFAVWPFGQSIRDQVRIRGHSGISVPVQVRQLPILCISWRLPLISHAAAAICSFHAGPR